MHVRVQAAGLYSGPARNRQEEDPPGRFGDRDDRFRRVRVCHIVLLALRWGQRSDVSGPLVLLTNRKLCVNRKFFVMFEPAWTR